MVPSLGVRFAGVAPTLDVALSASAYNLGTAVSCWLAGRALGAGLGTTGPAAVGTVIAALTVVPTVVLAPVRRRDRAARSTTTSYGVSVDVARCGLVPAAGSQ